MIQGQQDQAIKGFTLLELLVVISLVAIISAVAYPNFSSWKTEREVRTGTEKIASMLSNIATQTQRGNFSYSQFEILPLQPVQGKSKSTVFFTKGMKKQSFTALINTGASPACTITKIGHWDNLGGPISISGNTHSHYYEVYNPEKGIDDVKIATHLSSGAAICFGTSGNYYKATDGLSNLSALNINIEGAPTRNYIIICTLKVAETNGNKCPTGGSKLEKPAYLVKWSRFGNVSKYKWNGSGWNRQ